MQNQCCIWPSPPCEGRCIGKYDQSCLLLRGKMNMIIVLLRTRHQSRTLVMIYTKPHPTTLLGVIILHLCIFVSSLILSGSFDFSLSSTVKVVITRMLLLAAMMNTHTLGYNFSMKKDLRSHDLTWVLTDGEELCMWRHVCHRNTTAVVYAS